ncbi:MAG: hypothetical protein AAB526_03470 [Patescibacteria group bacterium]
MSVLKPQKQKIVKFSSKVASGIMAFSIILMGIFYLIQVNKLTVQGFQITDFKKQIVRLKECNKQLEIEFLQLQAVSKIEQASEELKMVKVDSLKYLEEMGVLAAR